MRTKIFSAAFITMLTAGLNITTQTFSATEKNNTKIVSEIPEGNSNKAFSPVKFKNNNITMAGNGKMKDFFAKNL